MSPFLKGGDVVVLRVEFVVDVVILTLIDAAFCLRIGESSELFKTSL